MTPIPPPPLLVPMTRIHCNVGALVSLGQAQHGERRYIPLTGGTVEGPELNGVVLDGGVDWQVRRADEVLEISAHYVLRTHDGALIEVQSEGLRHGPADVMARLARGDVVGRDEYFFRTIVRLQTGDTTLAHLNKTIAIGVGQREASRVVLDLYRLT